MSLRARLALSLFATAAVGFAACSDSGSDPAGEPDVLADAAEDVAATPDAAEDIAGPDAAPDEDAADADVEPTPFPARELPFEFTRPEDGEPIPAAEVTAFTEEVTGVWEDVGYFRWLLRTSTGVDASTGTDDYLAWHRDVTAVKTGDLVSFEHRGAEHNMRLMGGLRRRAWPPMTYMMIPSLLSQSDRFVANLADYEGEHADEVHRMREEIRQARADFRREA